MSSEILQIADQLAREKGIDRKVVIEAMEIAIQTASRRRHGNHKNIQARFDPKSGEFKLYQLLEVRKDIDDADDDDEDDQIFEDADIHIRFEDALRFNPDAKIGDYVMQSLPTIEFGRIAAQTAKQVIVQKVRDAERKRIYEEYIDRKGSLVNGLVKRVERNNVYVDLGRTGAFLPYDQLLPRERFHPGDRIRAYIYDVRDVSRGPQILLSRVHPQMLAKLFEMEVPEIYDGLVEIKGVARDPGHRSKMAVFSHDSFIDPVGACVGIRGARVQAVVTELMGERIDIIEWSPDAAVYVCNAMAPAEVSKVILDEDEQNIKVVVEEAQLSLAIGRRGQNVRLATELTEWRIDIITEQEETDHRSEEFKQRVITFMEALDLDEEVAAALVEEGFTDIEEVAYVPLEELSSIDGFDEEISQELRSRARDHLLQLAMDNEQKKEDLEIDSRLIEMEGVPDELLIMLGEKGVRSLDDLADLSTDELEEYTEGRLERKDAETLILMARHAAGWFDDEDDGEEQQEAEEKTKP
ncbi:transcription termination factor NusA [Magnetococcales bacterium HHB-1]